MNEFYYKDALKLGQKEARARTFKGQSPCLPVLEDFVSSAMINTGIDLGLVQIPAELIVGTKTRGRVNAFAPNFMPVLDETTEFADKWERLCQAHVTEGIRDPIKAYEYMNRFYVEEGNKRVSVLKFFDAVNIVGHVIRIMPTGSGDEVDLYNEFLDFYKLTKINFLEFTKKGSYALLQKALGKAVGEDWTEDEISRFTGTYYYFKKAYIQNGGEKLQSTVGDAMLSYIMVYGYHELKASDPADIKKNLSKMWQEVELHAEEEPIEVKTEPAEEKKKGVISKMISAATTPSVLSVAFIHDGTPERSGWIHDHEKGRKYVERIFEDKIVTTPYYNAMENDALKVIELAIEDGAELIFTTSPRLAQASLRAAVEHPEISIMNCSLNKSHRYISSYYTRMYEAKFILGAIAGSLTKSDKLGYVCDYPIYGQIAAINAFALGAQMANPRAKVYLEWSAVDGARAAAMKLVEQGIHYISSQDTARFREDDREIYGLSYINGERSELIANPVWKWGVYYEQILRRFLNKTMQEEYQESNKALNYYWGMSAGVVDVVYAPKMERASKRFADFLRDGIIQNVCTPFLTPLTKQSGEVIGAGQKSLALDQIISMDYLVENVIGTIPQYGDLNEMGKATVDTAGVEPAQEAADDTQETAQGGEQAQETEAVES
ncbi:MAG: BMP family ABC transporter substrate-binding protein [Ruminococcus sp.]|nr:BMP family ABC transporter substrate-binding protein [Ruminococcus sp.]